MGSSDAACTLLFLLRDHGRPTDRIPKGLARALPNVRLGLIWNDGGLAAPDELDQTLAASLRGAVDRVQGALWLGGMSRGARVAAALSEGLAVRGLLTLSYPFHPRRDPHPGDRVQLLAQTRPPVLLVQGTRDALGNREQVRGYGLPTHIQVHWVEDGNHALIPRPGRGDGDLVLQEALHAIRGFMGQG